MPNLAEPPAPADPVAHHGLVVEAPAGLNAPFTVQVPDFDDLHVFQIRRWQSRGRTLPAVGDEVLVVIDDVTEPWVAAWWPSGGDVVEVPSAMPFPRTEVADVDYAALASDYLIAFTALTAERTLTLPDAATLAERTFLIKDEAGAAATFNVTVEPDTEGQTLDGAPSQIIAADHGSMRVYSNAANWFLAP